LYYFIRHGKVFSRKNIKAVEECEKRIIVPWVSRPRAPLLRNHTCFAPNQTRTWEPYDWSTWSAWRFIFIALLLLWFGEVVPTRYLIQLDGWMDGSALYTCHYSPSWPSISSINPFSLSHHSSCPFLKHIKWKPQNTSSNIQIIKG